MPAPVAEKAADLPGHMVVVDAELPVPVVAVAADAALAGLCGEHRQVLVVRDAVLTFAHPAHDLGAFPLRSFGAVFRAVAERPASASRVGPCELGFAAAWHVAGGFSETS